MVLPALGSRTARTNSVYCYVTNMDHFALQTVFVSSNFLLVKQLRSPMQIVMAMDVDQRTELQSMIYDLEEENR